jgi:hypothetical protein
MHRHPLGFPSWIGLRMLKPLQKITIDPAHRSEIHLSAKIKTTVSTRCISRDSLHVSSVHINARWRCFAIGILTLGFQWFIDKTFRISLKHKTHRSLCIENIIGDAQDQERPISFSQHSCCDQWAIAALPSTSTIGPNCPTDIPWGRQILVFGLSAKVYDSPMTYILIPNNI